MAREWKQHPSARLDYDCTLRSNDGDTIASGGGNDPVVTISPGGAASHDGTVISGATAKIWIKDVVDAAVAEVTVLCTTTLGRKVVFQFSITGDSTLLT